MADWNPTPETAHAAMSAASGVVSAGLLQRAANWREWLTIVVVGLTSSYLLGGWLIAASGITPSIAYGGLAFTGVPIGRRIYKGAATAKVGSLPKLEPAEEAD